VRLNEFNSNGFDRGASRFKELLWILLSGLIFESWLPGTMWRCMLLRLFGAEIGSGVVIKPRVRIKFPWRLNVGSNTWIGEGVWIDNLANIDVGQNVCISQSAYFCTGSHDWSLQTFDLITMKIQVKDMSWVAAQARIGPGVTVGCGSVVCFGSTLVSDSEPWSIYSGSPAMLIGIRKLKVD
jgi:putative colanic acid biosynthesis acetyltransferase WcaF